MSTEKVKLLIIGSCRDDEDFKRVETLTNLAKSLNVDKYVSFRLNFTFENLLKSLAESAVGIHSMIDEHFGIGKYCLMLITFVRILNS
jgi:alpha-1,2-mannosyltransferase